MKFLISSEVLKRTIKDTLKNPPETFYIDSDNEEFIFESEQPIKMIITAAKQKFRGKFNSVQWERIYSFLTFLTEQPLTINMSDYGDNIHEHPEIVIYCNGVIFY